VSDNQDYGRHEFKYVLPLSARADVLRLAGDHAVPDGHAAPREDGVVGYYNHTLYLDTADLRDYRERLSLRRLRTRLRVRTYGQPGDRAPVFLEIKRKRDEWVVKHRVRVGDADTWTAHPHDRPWIEHARAANGNGRFAATHFLRLVEETKVPLPHFHWPNPRPPTTVARLPATRVNRPHGQANPGARPGVLIRVRKVGQWERGKLGAESSAKICQTRSVSCHCRPQVAQTRQ